MKRLIIAALAMAGVAPAPAPAAPSQISQPSERVAVKNGTSSRELEADHFHNYGASLLHGLLRRSHTPYEWGISQACARMHRHNKMRRCGIGGSKI